MKHESFQTPKQYQILNSSYVDKLWYYKNINKESYEVRSLTYVKYVEYIGEIL